RVFYVGVGGVNLLEDRVPRTRRPVQVARRHSSPTKSEILGKGLLPTFLLKTANNLINKRFFPFTLRS
ncbi:hypothetical protein, partial [Floridanema aerugineum]